ncbi:MAG: hypothetical protein OXH76_02245 [Boseongicola sp.]|nr:hypothetical protein [Boseongicola sp.]
MLTFSVVSPLSIVTITVDGENGFQSEIECDFVEGTRPNRTTSATSFRRDTRRSRPSFTRWHWIS